MLRRQFLHAKQKIFQHHFPLIVSSFLSDYKVPMGKTLCFLSILLGFFLGSKHSALASTGPARTSCDAAYNAACSRVNSEWLATDTTRRLTEDLQALQPSDDDLSVLQDVTLQQYNMEKGFYPFVFDRATSTCVAHGSNPALVGETLDSIFETMGIGFSSATALHDRFVQAATTGGDWVQYIWRDTEDTPIVNKVAFVTGVMDRYYLGVGYNHEQLPPDLPCSDKFDSWCSINNVRSLVGKAQQRINEAETLEQFEAALYDISFDNQAFVIPGGHYIFMYHYDGALKAHAHLHRFTGHDLPYIFENLNRDPEEGAALHETLRAAAEGENDGWAQYKWKNKVDEPEYIKIAYNVKIEFMGEEFYLGCGYNYIMGDVVPASTTSDSGCSPNFNLPCAFGTTLQLSSHALSHAVSSPLAVDDMFTAVAYEPSLQRGEYFVFMFDFNGTCVAHGAVPGYKGMTAERVFGKADVHEHFRNAAELGGGYVYYGMGDPNFQKISYIFQITLAGRSYYGGVGFDQQRAPVQLELDSGKQKNGDPIPCSVDYGSECSEINVRAIVGQALADLVIASTETKVRATTEATLSEEEVLSEITAQNDLYRVNDFYVSVFSLDQSLCSTDEEANTGINGQDNSGCCIAHGGNSTFVGKSWQDILDIQRITSIRGVDLHSRLIGQTDRGGHWTEYSWAESDGRAQTRQAFSSRFKHNSLEYYIVAEYVKDPPPPTCDACPAGMECTRDDQAFCEVAAEEETGFFKSVGFIALLSAILGVPLMAILFCWIGKRNEKRQAAAQIREIDDKMQTMTKQIEREKRTAAKAQKLVSSLFPQNVQDRILQEIDEPFSEEEETGPTTTTKTLTSFLKNDGTSKEGVMTKSSRPIADLFPEATIFFGDISGFTSWSSTRNPSQVFSLLETLYQKFDRIASSLDVFKVETIGDCYVAVCGLPEPREDHVIVMARFASECLYHFSVLVKKLEVELGPDTGDLGLRIGLHSGPVTAGVLRGERGRFQLFGDTVNTASRMESTGISNKIHLSQETADLLGEAGKGPERSPEATPVATGDTQLAHKNNRLVKWNVDILSNVLINVIRWRKACGIRPESPECLRQLEEDVESTMTTLKEVKEIVSLPRFNPEAVKQHVDERKELDQKVQEELRSYVAAIMQMYRENPFHSFEHASHVTMSVVKLLDRIVAPQIEDTSFNSLHDHTYGITSDPLVQFACILSALIHDVDHPGVPNRQLIKEQNPLAASYENKSVAELNSLDLSWSLLMQDDFALLRRQIYCTEAEFHRFRQLMVNIVLATDVVDKELKSLRNARWEKAFSKTAPKDENQHDTINRKATIVIEHLIQASDVSHTMQHWMVYRKWNERFFKECYEAFLEGRAETDPSIGWYRGEMGFFDFYIIPLAKKLKDCGVFGVSSDEYLRYALNNRREWEARGEEVVASMLEKYR